MLEAWRIANKAGSNYFGNRPRVSWQWGSMDVAIPSWKYHVRVCCRIMFKPITKFSDTFFERKCPSAMVVRRGNCFIFHERTGIKERIWQYWKFYCIVLKNNNCRTPHFSDQLVTCKLNLVKIDHANILAHDRVIPSHSSCSLIFTLLTTWLIPSDSVRKFK